MKGINSIFGLMLSYSIRNLHCLTKPAICWIVNPIDTLCETVLTYSVLRVVFHPYFSVVRVYETFLHEMNSAVITCVPYSELSTLRWNWKEYSKSHRRQAAMCPACVLYICRPGLLLCYTQSSWRGCLDKYSCVYALRSTGMKIVIHFKYSHQSKETI